MQNQMTAWTIAETGAPPALRTHPRPRPGPGEVLVRVAAAGLNFADLLMVQGRYQDRIAPPFVPGLELAGTVCGGGPGTGHLPPGTRIATCLRCGGFAEWAVVRADRAVPLPDDMPFETAAGFLIAYGTSHMALMQTARLSAGETLFVTGAAGGVGLTAVEIGHIAGARVIAMVRGAQKAAIARAAGADEVIDSDATPDLKDRLRALGGIDVTYDTVGGAGFDAALRATRPGGRMLAIGFAGGVVPQVPLNRLLVRNVTVAGFWWGGQLDLAPDAARATLTQLMGLWQAGRLRPHIGQVLPFDGLLQGLDALRDRRAMGKLVLRMPDGAAAA